MAKTPSKRGSGRGKTGTGSGKPATKPDDTRKDTGRKAAGKKAGGKKLPGWMPDAPPAGKPSRRDKPAAGKPGAGSTGGVHDPHAPAEADRYEKPLTTHEALLQVLVAPDGPPSAAALAPHLGPTQPAHRLAPPHHPRRLSPVGSLCDPHTLRDAREEHRQD